MFRQPRSRRRASLCRPDPTVLRVTGRGGRLVALAVGVVVVGLAIGGSTAGAAQPECQVVNLPPKKSLFTSNSYADPLGQAIEEAEPGDTLQVVGTCHGNYVITKDLTIQGRSSESHVDSIAGESTGMVLLVPGNAVGVHLAVSHLTITNGATAGIGAYAGVVTVTDSVVTGNAGTGIGNFSNAKVSVDSTTISDNHASGGGGVWNSIGGSGSMTITNSVITGNSATINGGGIFNRRSLTLTNTVVVGNTATNGGGIYMLSGSAALNDTSVSGNTVTANGGGIYVRQGTAVTLTNSGVSGNHAASGGGIYTEPGGTVAVDGTSSVVGNTPDDWAP